MVIELFHKIIKAGGFVNSHSHFDRSYTYNHFTADDAYLHLTEKWQLVDKFKRDADVYKYYQNIKTSIDNQLHYSVNKACTFIDY